MTATHQVYTVNAFVHQGRGGNGAGVVLQQDEQPASIKQKIATYLGHSETAFITPINDQHHRISFFTPNQEVDLCGHATVASYFLLQQLEHIKNGTFNMSCRAGDLNIDVSPNGIISMEQTLPQFFETLQPETIAPLLNLTVNEIGAPIQIVSTGLRKILCPITTLRSLDTIEADLVKIRRLSEKHQVTGIYCFTLESQTAEFFGHCRNFAPLVGIDEDGATGTSIGALGSYLFHCQLFDGDSLLLNI